MRARRAMLAGSVAMSLLWGLGAGAAEPSETERAWATIRDGVLVDRAEWEARFAALDPSDEKQVRELRRSVRKQHDLVSETNRRPRCLQEAWDAASGATGFIDAALNAYDNGTGEDAIAAAE